MNLSLALNRSMLPCQGAPQYTERELSILCLMAVGLTNIETAAKLHISRHTVAQYIAGMLRATGARNRAELVARAYCDGILRTGIWPPKLHTRAVHLSAKGG
jgi:DNA-binding CsgD family transcriptional regulator